MRDKVYNVLFVCTGNAVQSIMAESVMNHQGLGRFRAFSAGSQPEGEVHPLALEALRRQNMPVEGLRSKSWHEFARPDAPVLDYVLSVCDKTAVEDGPDWPGQPITAMWGVPDPLRFQGGHDDKLRAFSDTLDILKHRIGLMQALILDSLEVPSLQQRMSRIGRV